MSRFPQMRWIRSEETSKSRIEMNILSSSGKTFLVTVTLEAKKLETIVHCDFLFVAFAF